MGAQKKHGKGRLDKWYYLAKEKGYRARAAFKLVQLNKRYKFLEQSKVLIDLCCAPGSWCQVAAEHMPINSLILGIDLVPVKPIPRCILAQADITSDKCRSIIRQHLKTWKADTVLHDGAPNVGVAWVQDAYSQAELVLQALKLAVSFLVKGGNFVTKIFRSKDYNSLIWVFNKLFRKVEATKPPSSRNVSAEIFVVCRDYLAPDFIDPKLLNARYVFADLQTQRQNYEAKVFNPEQKRRHREGYEDGNITLYRQVSACEFIKTVDPISMLGVNNKISFEQNYNSDLALTTLLRLPETTKEVRNCCTDLKVLGRKEFKLLLKWRLKVREIFGLSMKKLEEKKSEDIIDITPLDEDAQIQEELKRIKEAESTKAKKIRRKENERKRKDIIRMQLNMTTPFEVGMDHSRGMGDDSVFELKSIDRAGLTDKFSHGEMPSKEDEEEEHRENFIDGRSEGNDNSDAENENLEFQLDAMYEEYKQRRLMNNAKYRAKISREEVEDGEWNGIISASESDYDDKSSNEGGKHPTSILKTFSRYDQVNTSNGLSQKAAMFFDQDIFIDMKEEDDDLSLSFDQSKHKVTQLNEEKKKQKVMEVGEVHNPNSFEIVPHESKGEMSGCDSDEESLTDRGKSALERVTIATEEAMALAQALALNKVTKCKLEDETFHRYSYNDTKDLPAWFVDDEKKHTMRQSIVPVTEEAKAAIRAQNRAMNVRTIKKVAEARARRKMKAARQLSKLRAKSEAVLEDDGLSERDKASSITRLMARAKSAAKRQALQRRKVKIVVARGANKGVSGRPKGVKGRYKIVDSRMKKDLRAQKRLKRR